MDKLREKGILKRKTQIAPPVPVSAEEARIIMDVARQKRRQQLGIAG